jgi:hypothetical protein
MSRLDDELRIALRREEPSQGFADRVMRQIAAPAARKRSLWQALVSLVAPPRMRWVAVGVSASLIVAVSLLQLGRNQRPAGGEIIEAVPPVAATARAPLPAPPAGGSKDGGQAAAPDKAPAAVKNIKRRASRPAVTAQRTPAQLAHKRKGEAARDKLLLALRIASETLHETQRLIQGQD